MAVEKGRSKLVEECKEELNRTRLECLDGLKRNDDSLRQEITGDEGDMSKAFEERNSAHVLRDKLELRLREVEMALKRIEEDCFGFCEETGEEIESRRLKAIPWTRFSREGAEIRERKGRQYASKSGFEEEFGVETLGAGED